ncbi:hypothetical protein [Sphingomonas sp. AX6]|uniref:hypothetical protein n=1 Tax=Sphingomonas sp. AX6 TaxID=2653171 RepID=UPI0012F42EDE|nr:hypothetical protein [Sphingomonas sp. AX6]VXC99140.1 conserved exported hypothetical protein [Sphingomonas sp. AX6]
MISIAKPFVTATAVLLVAAVIPPAASQEVSSQIQAQAPANVDYPQLAAQVIEAPLIVDATVRSTSRIRGEEAIGLAPGHVRYYVTADVLSLIRGTTAIPSRIGYLVDLPFDSRGRAPNLRRLRVILFARPVPGRADQVQLLSNDAHYDWSPERDSLIRQIAREVVSPDAPPEITGVGNAFHTPGDLPGQGETQIFLLTARNDPISLSILRRPDGSRNWAVSLGEIVGEGSRPPERDTLLWYRLACGLPGQLPESNVAADLPEHAAIVREDYQYVLESLGLCRGSGTPTPNVGW